MNNKYILLILISFLFSGTLFSQTTIKGIVTDGDSGNPVSNALVTFNDNWETEVYTTTNVNGEFIFENIRFESYEDEASNIYITKDIYEDEAYDMNFDVNTEDSTFFNLVVYNDNSEYWDTLTWVTDIAKQNYLDFGYSLNFYSPKIDETDNYFKSNLSADFFFEFQFKIIKNLQIGTKITPFKMAWDNIKTDTIITTTTHEKERYFSVSSEYFIFLRYVSEAYDSKGIFVDFGAGYSLPYTFKYQYNTDKYIKTSVRNIHNFNNFQAMFRVGFYAFDIKATYRLTDFLKDKYIQTPRLNIGIEFNIPIY